MKRFTNLLQQLVNFRNQGNWTQEEFQEIEKLINQVIEDEKK